MFLVVLFHLWFGLTAFQKLPYSVGNATNNILCACHTHTYVGRSCSALALSLADGQGLQELLLKGC